MSSVQSIPWNSRSEPASGTETLLYVPKAIHKPCPLVVYLHGAGGSEEQGDLGFLLLSPASAGGTWDAIRGEYGADVRLIDRALARVFAMAPVNPERVSVVGFSDASLVRFGARDMQRKSTSIHRSIFSRLHSRSWRTGERYEAAQF